MTGPILSVIMLTYNRERYITEAITSVLNQTFQEIELIIIDDGSSDRTEIIVNEINSSRILYYKFPHSGKGSQLRNLGLEKSHGKFIAFIDSDDVWLPEKIRIQLDKLYSNSGKPGFVFSDILLFNNSGEVLKSHIYKDVNLSGSNLFSQYVENEFAIYPSTILFDKRCLEATGKLSELFSWTDNDFFHRMAFYYDGFLIKKPLVKIRRHDTNTSAKAGQKTIDEMMHMLTDFHKKGMINKSVFVKMISYYYYLSGMLFLNDRDYFLARKAFLNCIQNNPFNLKAWIRGGLTYFNILKF